ncbi:MAG TPA: hypothetical protein VF771_19015 [Longimicrobiaceae bacterium]
MQKVKLSVEELTIESFEVAAEDALGTVNAQEAAPTARTFYCPCIELTSPYQCG